MTLGRLRPAELLVAVASVALALSLWATWYSVGPQGGGAAERLEATVSGWEAFTVIDLVLALAAVVGLTLVVAQAASRSPTLPISVAVLAATAGIVATLLVAARILDGPGPDEALELGAGAWLGLAAAALLTAGAWWSMRDERSPGAPEPRVAVRPAPPSTG